MEQSFSKAQVYENYSSVANGRLSSSLFDVHFGAVSTLIFSKV